MSLEEPLVGIFDRDIQVDLTNLTIDLLSCCIENSQILLQGPVHC